MEFKDSLLPDSELKALFSEWTDKIVRKSYYDVKIEDKLLKIPMPIKRISRYISKIYAEIDHADEPTTWKERKRLQKKVDTLDVRVASAILLNRWFILPGLHGIYWRFLERFKTDKFIAGVIHCGYMVDKQGFFLLSSSSIKTHYEYQQMMIKMDQK